MATSKRGAGRVAAQAGDDESGATQRDFPEAVDDESIAEIADHVEAYKPLGSCIEVVHEAATHAVENLRCLYLLVAGNLTQIKDVQGVVRDIDRGYNLLLHLARLHRLRTLMSEGLPDASSYFRGMQHSFKIGAGPSCSCAHVAVDKFVGSFLAITNCLATTGPHLTGWISGDPMPGWDPYPRDVNRFLLSIASGVTTVWSGVVPRLGGRSLGTDYDTIRAALLNEAAHARDRLQREALTKALVRQGDNLKEMDDKGSHADGAVKRDPVGVKERALMAVYKAELSGRCFTKLPDVAQKIDASEKHMGDVTRGLIEKLDGFYHVSKKGRDWLKQQHLI